MTPLYGLRGLKKRFDTRQALDIPELDLQGEVIYGLLGPNGSGKTTLLRLLSFMDAPTEGEIRFRGEPVAPETMARHRAKVVWVPQSPVMFTGSLLYNVAYPMAIKGIGKAPRRERAMELLAKVGLEKLANWPAAKLSGGEAQRGSIARALAAGAEVILFDEPTASVDYHAREDIITLIRELHGERGISVIIATHDFFLARELCEQYVYLFDGRVAAIGTDDPLRSAPF
ncbi:MAG: ATP-binding cassette domain-containing protein [Desulfovibrio sp.]|jgi:ABC-type multidrug transport system ATPase subunit|nr:ATP-binding cassette domain-containing protein [Desulfovibrio sp.]